MDPPTLNLVPYKRPPTPLSNCENSSAMNSPQKDLSCCDMDRKAKKKRKLESMVFDKEEMSKMLTDEMYKFCKAGGIAGMLNVDENNSVMALCTPFMLRVHSYLKHSGDLVFVVAYGDLDEPNCCRVYLLVTYSAIGAVPLGCLVTTSISVSCLKAALDLWKQTLPAERFFNKSDGPEIFFTNDDEFEKEALQFVFPKSQLLICLSHILQSAWTFLLDRKNTIKKEHRTLFFAKIKMILFSQTAQELEMNYAYATADNLVKSNTVFLDYLNHIYNHRHDWSLVYCRHLFPDFSLFWESTMIILKDPILSRTRTYNQLQVIDFLSRIDSYYERRLIDLANNRLDSVRLSRFVFVELPREAYTITQFSDLEYEVHNDTKDTSYQVDVSLGMCECRTGRSGAPCKHQLLVFRNFHIPVYDCIPSNTAAENNNLFLLATGHPSISESAPDSVPKTTSAALQITDAFTTEIVIHDLDTCNENAFFLDDTGACETLNQASAITSLSQSASVVSLASDSLVQPTATVLHQQVTSIISTQDSMLPHNLLSQLDSDPSPPIPLSSELNPSLDPPLPPPDSTLQTLCETEPDSVVQIIDNICNTLKERTSKSTSTFKPALRTFLKNLEKLTSDSSLEYALYSFGKFSKSASPLFKRKIADNKLIGLQSTGELKKKNQLLKRSKVQKKPL